jgi:Flp pilus assembly protein TadD
MSVADPGGAPTEARWISVPEALSLAERQRLAGELGSAEKLCRLVLGARPDHPGALHLLGIILHQKGDLGAGIEMLEQATAVNGNVALFHANLGEMCRQAGRLEEAVSAGRRALELEPDNPNALNNLGVAYYDREQYGRAVDCHQRALQLAPSSAEAHNALGSALLALGDAAAALACYRRAVALKPDYVDAHSNLAMTLLLTGDFEGGWREFEWRHRRTGRWQPRPPRPEWLGESFVGKTLLITAEEGHGDAIHFLRYLPAVAARGGNIVLAVHRPLVQIARRLTTGAEVMALEERLPAFDLYRSLMSLPLVFGTSLESVPAQVPYLSVDRASAERWRARLAGTLGLKVGLIWSGAIQYGHNRHRAIPAKRLSPLLDIEGISWFSLQLGEPSVELAQLPAGKITDLSSELKDFSETAGAILALDLVISTDTAVPHLAGALARPVWVLLAFMPDWRWLLNRETSPWYPTMRLFRQSAAGEWDAVVNKVAAELRLVVSGDRARLTPFAREGTELSRDKIGPG